MAELLQQFGFDEARRQSHKLLAEDYRFAPAFPAGQAFKTVHERVFMEETPLAVVRELHLQHSAAPHSSLELTLALALNGFPDAMTLLDRFVHGFQRFVPPERVRNIHQTNQIGEFGVAWQWDPRSDGLLDVMAFVRHNVLVAASAHDPEPGLVLALAVQIDRELNALSTVQDYAEPGRLSIDRAECAPRVAAGGRLELRDFGAEDRDGATLFFVPSSGSVNRDPANPQRWYYRAGEKRGTQQIMLYRVARGGILPARQRLNVEVA